MWIFWITLGLLAILIALLVVRAIQFVPKPSLVVDSEKITIDETHAIDSLKAMIKFKTVSHVDRSLNDESEFIGFRGYLRQRYPRINKTAHVFELPDSAIVFHFKGKSAECPSVLMAHYDVVPENGVWKYNPFLGEEIDGAIYGRGTLDTKGSLCGVMESVEHLLEQNHVFDNDLYLAFCGDEEVSGRSAEKVVDYLKKNNVSPKLVLDEGGAIVSKVFPGVKKKAAVIGLAEKGFIALELSSTSAGGHASTPPKKTPITHLAKAVTAMNEGRLFKMKLTGAVHRLFDTVARHSESFAIKIIFANLWLFLPIVKLLAKKDGGQLLSLFKTTQAFTMMQGSEAVNVLPTKASIGVNYRLLTGETTEEVVKKVNKKVNNEHVHVRVVYGNEASAVSMVDENYGKIERAIAGTWNDVVVTPYLMMAATDSRFYHAISENVYRFSPMELTKEELGSIHGVDEAIQIHNLIACVKFYIRLLKQL